MGASHVPRAAADGTAVAPTCVRTIRRSLASAVCLVLAFFAAAHADTVTVPVERWFDGTKELTVPVPASPKVVRVELDPAQDLPDVNRANGLWPRGAATAERRRPGQGPGPGAGPAPTP